MNDFPKEAWAAIGAAIGIISTIIAGLFKARREDHEAAASLRDELRRDNAMLRERIESLEAMVQKMADERLTLQRDLDIRNHELAVLKTKVDKMQRKFEVPT